ncbi:MAG: translocation/assembly module TamB domain-containing protein [Gammaproteobacteria bacterium]|nr:translocation/assembly module TamB domain-containing protein [Gammaproteobacteria bacterium]
MATAGGIRGNLAVAGSADHYDLEMTARTREPATSRWLLKGRGNSQSVDIHSLSGQLPQGKVSAEGRLEWHDVPALMLQGDWQDVVLALPDRELQLPGGSFSIEGTPEHYTLTTAGSLQAEALPAVDWQAEASGDQNRLSIDKLRLSLLEGEITASGRAGWTPAPTLDADIRLQTVNPGSYWPDWPGQLSGQTSLSLQRKRDSWHAAVDGLQLEGRLRDYPVKATGTASTDTNEYHVRQLRVTVADSHLTADGRLSRDSQLTWEFKSPDLEQLIPDAGGEAEATGRLGGDYRQPELIATVSAGDLNTPWLELVRLDADIDIRAAQDRFSVAIDAAGLQLDRQTIDSVTVNAGGGLDRHELETTLEFDGRSLSLAGGGQWREGVWSLDLDEGHYRGAATGDWQLESPLQIALSDNSVQSPEHCWQQQAARLCLAAGWQRAGAWHGRFDLGNYAIAERTGALTDAVPPIDGELAVTLEVRGQDRVLEHAEGDIRLRDLTLRPDGQTELRISRLDVELAGDDSGIDLDINGDFAEPAPGTLTGRIRTGRLDLAQPVMTTLSGDINADIGDLRPWLVLYPRFTAEQARLAMDFTLGGQIGTPELDGEMRLSATDAAIPDLGIGMQTFELKITGQPQTGLELSGQATSGPGELAIDGRVDIADGALVLPEMRIKGERFELINLPEAWILASPDLRLQYADNLLSINGEVAVPEALIQPFGAPGTIPVSGDEYIVTAEEEKPAPTLKTRADISLQLGDEVRISGRGFEGRLEGRLDIRQEPDKPASANGELRLAEGSYSAYGQELNVRSGDIIFTNRPIDNPAIEAEAVRSVGNVTAGVRASGTARQPVTELFSTPTMPEADILSYLVLGQPLNSATSGEGDVLLQAATSMGIKGSEGLRQTIAGTLGLDTLAVDTGTTAEGDTEASLVIGKYLSPNLYLSYGAGLVDTAVDTVKLRYEINRHLSLEAQQGAGTGVDLFYQIESGGWGE